MKRIVTLGIAALVLSSAAAYAEGICSNETVKGSYGVIVSGTAPASSVLPQFPSALYPVGASEQFMTVVVHTFDGEGKFTQTESAKGYLSGPALDRTGGGTYSVNSNCTGIYSLFIPGLSFPVVVVRFVIVEGGKEFRGIVVTPQEAMVTANGRRM